MGDTLRVAHEKEAYVISDRGTYLSLKDDLELEILVEATRCSLTRWVMAAIREDEHVKYDLAKNISISHVRRGAGTIASFEVKGEQLFFPGLGIQE